MVHFEVIYCSGTSFRGRSSLVIRELFLFFQEAFFLGCSYYWWRSCFLNPLLVNKTLNILERGIYVYEIYFCHWWCGVVYWKRDRCSESWTSFKKPWFEGDHSKIWPLYQYRPRNHEPLPARGSLCNWWWGWDRFGLGSLWTFYRYQPQQILQRDNW